MTILKVGLAGFGTVGGGTWKVCKENTSEILRRSGKEIRIVAIAEPDQKKLSKISSNDFQYFNDAIDMLDQSEVDVIVELIGGESFSKEFVLKSLKKGKHVVTANKALLAKHGEEIFKTADENNVCIGFEAAVAGGIPILKVIREGLAANNIEFVAGIINGTSNYIITEMEKRGIPFEEALSEAQELGFAEADPSLDIDGYDAAHKIVLLASMSFGAKVNFDDLSIQGIRKLDLRDVNYAKKLGYRIKSLGIARKINQGLEVSVESILIPSDSLMSNVNGAMNAVLVKGNSVGSTMYYGQGAGAEPTASAVVADLVEISRNLNVEKSSKVPALSYQSKEIRDLEILDSKNINSSFYIRLRVADESGVLADITKCLSEQKISIDAFFQNEMQKDISTEVIILTHQCYGENLSLALKSIKFLDSVIEDPVFFRVEPLE